MLNLSVRCTAASLARVFLFCLILAPLGPVFGQSVVTSGLTGQVRDSSGRPVAGVLVRAVHVPTGTAYSASATSDGRYNFRGLIAGGPYTVTAAANGLKSAELRDINTQIGADTTVDVFLEASDVVTLDKFTVGADRSDLDPNATGAGTFLDSQRLAAKPTTQRSLADLVSASPFVALRSLSSANDREEAQITALGQNNRYNSVLIDGARINDQFGLNATGLASFFNPLSIDTIEQLSVQVAPYDVRFSGFTGASINAITRSGTNVFHGSAYGDLSRDKLFGFRGQGKNVAPGTTQGLVPALRRTTYGFTLGGPIIKNHLFFFANYEKFERLAAPLQAGLTPAAADVALITAQLNAIKAAIGKPFPFGTVGGSAVNRADDKKKLAKIDWNIISGQRLSLRYSETNGQVPQFGSYNVTSFTGISGLTGTGTTAYDSNFYAQLRKEKSITGRLNSQWTDNFKTEISYTDTKQDQYTPTVATLPEIRIYGINGQNQSAQTISNGVLVVGTDQFRQGNQVNVKVKNYSANGDYFLGNLTLTAGFDREKTDFYNLFRAGSYGLFDFASIAAFQADTVSAQSRAYYVQGTPIADVSDATVTGIFLQGKIELAPRLTLIAGVRDDIVESSTKPPFNQLFKDRFGLANNGTVDGVNTVSPRGSFNWGIDPKRTLQLRGGAGHLLGRAPWVFFSNSYSAPGIGRYSIVSNGGSLIDYLKNSFDPANPIGTSTGIPAGGRYEIDFADPKIKLPSLWRGNLAVDYKLPFLGATASAEIVQSYNDEALFITNDNLTPISAGADGRYRFAGNVNTVANARYGEFLNVYHIKNVRTGESRYVTFTFDRAMKNHWAFDLSYTRGRATDAQTFGQTTASGQWQRNAIFNQGAVEEAHSDFEVRNRYTVSVTKQFEFAKGWLSSISLFYDGRTGNPYSFTYSNDLNGDSMSGNDLVAVPKDVNDARFDFSQMSASDQINYFAFLNRTGLNQYAGGVAPRNAFVQPFVSRLDLHVEQEIPIYKPIKVSVFLDFTNFGMFISPRLFQYYNIAPQNSNDVFWRRYAGSATYGPDGRIRPNFAAPSSTEFLTDNVQSRWRIQVGARLRF